MQVGVRETCARKQKNFSIGRLSSVNCYNTKHKSLLKNTPGDIPLSFRIASQDASKTNV